MNSLSIAWKTKIQTNSARRTAQIFIARYPDHYLKFAHSTVALAKNLAARAQSKTGQNWKTIEIKSRRRHLASSWKYFRKSQDFHTRSQPKSSFGSRNRFQNIEKGKVSSLQSPFSKQILWEQS